MRRTASLLLAFLLSLALMAPASAQAARRAWVARYDGTAGGDEALVVTTTSGGGRIIVAGLTEGADYIMSVAVVAYRYDGNVAWRARFAPPASYEPTYVEDIVVSKDDREVIVTAPLIGPGHDPMAVVGFDASSGVLDWSWLSTPVTAYPRDLATAPDTVFVVGTAGRRDMDRFVAALRPLSGDVVWTQRSDAPLGDAAADSVMARDGQVFVAGSVATKDSPALRTVAYAAGDGSLSWQDTFRRARSGSVIHVTGDGSTLSVQAGWKIIRYDAQTGARLRLERLDAVWKGAIRDVTVGRRGWSS